MALPRARLAYTFLGIHVMDHVISFHFHVPPVHREGPILRDPQVLCHLCMLFLVLTTHILGGVFSIPFFIIKHQVDILATTAYRPRFVLTSLTVHFFIAGEDPARWCAGLVN